MTKSRDESKKTGLPKTNVFSFGRSAAVTRRVLQQIRRDKRTLGMMVMMPAIVMIIFGFSLSGEVKNIPILVDNKDLGYVTYSDPSTNVTLEVGDKLTKALQSNDHIKSYLGDFDEGKAGVDKGVYFAAIRVPANFSETVFMRSRGQSSIPILQIYMDPTKPAIEASILSTLQSSLQPAFGVQFFSLDQQLAFGGTQFTGLDVSIPSVIAFVLTFLVLLISLIIISRESITGTLNRLYATPLTALERLVGYVMALLLLGIMMAGVILGIGVGIFGTVVRGSFLILLFAAILYALSHVLMAVFLSNFARNELQAVQMAPLISLPSMALSGMLVPVNSLPDFIQPFSRLIPLYYGNRLFEGIMLKGYGVVELASDFLIVGVIAVIFFVLALMTVKDKINA